MPPRVARGPQGRNPALLKAADSRKDGTHAPIAQRERPDDWGDAET